MDTNKKEFRNLPNASLIYKVDRQDRFSTKNTIKSYETAKMLAQSIDYPNRYNLYQLYDDIIEDSHLKAAYTQRKSRVLGLPFSVINESNDRQNDKATKMFDDLWFYDYISFVMDSIFYGNVLLEVSNYQGKLKLTQIPKENVIPEFKEIKYDPWSMSGNIDYSQPAYAKNLIDINNNNDPRDLGELLNLTKLVLIKNEVLLNWAQYVEIFGQPLRVGTTDSQDPTDLATLENWLSNLGRSGYAIKDSATQLEFVESGGGNTDLYDGIIERINTEISKQILGVTMLTDDGSSRSQSVIHQNASYLITKSDIRNVEYEINNKLIPILKDFGFIQAKNIRFQFDEIEMLTIDEKLQIDQFLIDNFEMKDLTYFEERYGVELEGFKTMEEPTDENTMDEEIPNEDE